MTLRLLSDATPDERAALSAVRYQPNEAVLHSDAVGDAEAAASCWASWVYVEPTGPRPEKIDLTYWMNSLQPIPMDDPLFVTLNSNSPIREELIHDTVTFDHPVYDMAALRGAGDAARDERRARHLVLRRLDAQRLPRGRLPERRRRGRGDARAAGADGGMSQVDHIRGETFHGRKGAVTNSFRYGVDYVLLDPETAAGPSLFSRNRAEPAVAA